MGTTPETEQAAPTDAELGAALRKIAEANGGEPKSFDWYATNFVRFAGDKSLSRLTAQTIRRVKVFVHPPGRSDGLFEMIVEMISGEKPTCMAAAFDGHEMPWGDDLMDAVERIYSDAVDNCGMVPSDDARSRWHRILQGKDR